MTIESGASDAADGAERENNQMPAFNGRMIFRRHMPKLLVSKGIFRLLPLNSESNYHRRNSKIYSYNKYKYLFGMKSSSNYLPSNSQPKYHITLLQIQTKRATYYLTDAFMFGAI
jgi:hypothetical protein